MADLVCIVIIVVIAVSCVVYLRKKKRCGGNCCQCAQKCSARDLKKTYDEGERLKSR